MTVRSKPPSCVMKRIDFLIDFDEYTPGGLRNCYSGVMKSQRTGASCRVNRGVTVSSSAGTIFAGPAMKRGKHSLALQLRRMFGRNIAAADLHWRTLDRDTGAHVEAVHDLRVAFRRIDALQPIFLAP